MFELPEYVILAGQMNDTLQGKTIQSGQLGNSPHKFVWYNRDHEEFEQLTRGKVLGEARARGRWLFVPCQPGYVLLFGECGGKMLYHQPGAEVPKKYHLYITFEDGSFFTVMTQMWGAMELHEQGQELERQYVKEMKPTPIEPEFTAGYFNSLLDEVAAGKKQSVKGLLTQDQTIPGLGNAIAQDIMFQARLHPKHPIDDLSVEQRQALHQAILATVDEVIEKGGRYDEIDLYGNPGKYIRLMDKNTFDHPCPACGEPIRQMQYLGGACYFCPQCQV
jgi:formamidopyrimidine-DNA glycosylase